MMPNVLRGVQTAEGIALVTGRNGSADVRFESLFREHYPRVTSMLVRLTGDRGQAEEIAADVFCKLSRQSGLPENREELTPWIYRVATNAGLDAIRSNTRRRRHEDAAGAESLRAVARPTALDEILRQERCNRVQAVLGTMKPRDAQLLLLRATGLAYRELAETLGINAASIGTLLVRAEAEFERKFRARYGDNV